MDFEPYFKVHNLVAVHPKSIILRQMTNLNMIFHAVMSVYRLVKIWNSPQFPDEFWNGNYPVKAKPWYNTPFTTKKLKLLSMLHLKQLLYFFHAPNLSVHAITQWGMLKHESIVTLSIPIIKIAVNMCVLCLLLKASPVLWFLSYLISPVKAPLATL